MSSSGLPGATLSRLDEATRALVQLSAVVAAGTEELVRITLQGTARTTPHEWIDELLLQTYLFAGFPRALNAMREWRRIAPSAVSLERSPADAAKLTENGERTCALVYGPMYDRLRQNIRSLHPSLDEWMIVEGYGKVLSRGALDLRRRELCIVAACAATGQDRQLQSHLHGARNVGVADGVLTESIASLAGIVPEETLSRAMRLWERIR